MPSPRRQPLVFALFVNAALLAVIALILFSRDNHNPSGVALGAPFPQSQGPIAGGGGYFVTPAQFSSTSWGCYLMDIDNQTLSAYQFFPGDRALRLVAVRSFRYDHRLTNFNSDRPSPQEVKELLDQEEQALPRMTPGEVPSTPTSKPAENSH